MVVNALEIKFCNYSMNQELILSNLPPLIEDITLATIKAPAFLWYGSGVIVFFTVIFAITLLRSFFPLRSRLLWLARKIKGVGATGERVTGTHLEQLRDIFSEVKDANLKKLCSEFEKTLLVEGEAPSTIYRTCSASDVFSPLTAIQSRINTRFYEAVPSIITGFGLLLTFSAILWGLSHIHESLDPITQVKKIEGVQELVFSLSGKFLSSVVALVCAIIFTLVERTIEGKLERHLHKLTHALNTMLDRKAAEQLLYDIKAAITTQAVAFNQFNTSLSPILSKSISEGINPLIERLSSGLEDLNTAIADLKQQKSESFTDSLSTIVGEFRQALMGSTQNEFQILAKALSENAAASHEMNLKNNAAQEKMDALVSQLNTFLLKQTQAGEQHPGTLQATMEQVLTRLLTTSESASATLQERTNEIPGRLEASALRQAQESAKQSESLSTLLANLSQQMEQSVTSSTKDMRESMSNVLQNTANWSQATAEEIRSLMRDREKDINLLEDARKILQDSLKEFRSELAGHTETSRNIGIAGETLRMSCDALGEKIKSLDKTQESALYLQNKLQTGLSGLLDSISRNAELLQTYQTTIQN